MDEARLREASDILGLALAPFADPNSRGADLARASLIVDLESLRVAGVITGCGVRRSTLGQTAQREWVDVDVVSFSALSREVVVELDGFRVLVGIPASRHVVPVPVWFNPGAGRFEGIAFESFASGGAPKRRSAKAVVAEAVATFLVPQTAKRLRNVQSRLTRQALGLMREMPWIRKLYTARGERVPGTIVPASYASTRDAARSLGLLVEQDAKREPPPISAEEYLRQTHMPPIFDEEMLDLSDAPKAASDGRRAPPRSRRRTR